jgi:hypothetical protein
MKEEKLARVRINSKRKNEVTTNSICDRKGTRKHEKC